MDASPNTEEGVDDYLERFKAENMPEKLFDLRHKLYQKAKNEPKFRFYTLYSLICREDVLRLAWKLVKNNKGAAGVDGVKLEDVERRPGGVDEFLKEIGETLRAHNVQTTSSEKGVYTEGTRRKTTVRDTDSQRQGCSGSNTSNP